ncbi:hypothetical protein EIP91_000406 [Steccherinum ochraceum]|uniref:DUF6533 domain-containing protein n=1 Tax=Steccherinum ochraceum TaxID=92696 RepID=A0A4R0RFS0_9APHY|nr:hypothetical protein EIP91_000406 [Steccherinum ochraceum]
MAAPPPPDPSVLITAATHLAGAKYYAMASFVMMTYDILLTFPTELEKIWKQRYSGVTVLWFMNRWFFLAAVIPTIASLHVDALCPLQAFMIHILSELCGYRIDHVQGSPAQFFHSCERYFRYPGYIAAIQRVVIGSIFILRMYCIYGRDYKVAVLIAVFLIVEVIIKLYATIAWGQAVQLPPGFVACVLSVSPENSAKFIIFWVFELVTDTLVVFLTVFRSFQLRRSASIWQSRLWQVLVKDGLMYFFVMFATNLITVIMYIVASQDLKAVNADFGVMINAVMTARLILNLKTANSRAVGVETNTDFARSIGTWEANIVGNLGNEFEGQFSNGTTEDGLSTRRNTRNYPRRSVHSDSTSVFEMHHRNW